ncbi:hypothetical protein PVAND_016809 [Polypedilum vanderplanki]|uniref:Secreted protein n=1 Tax=Polypedilum vanderplanki TaxID=319348 RepID=A0A9J6BG80_POLVA|nr:hypothetical protein PVAND_016809 [Polypedilum vanderplanki]
MRLICHIAISFFALFLLVNGKRYLKCGYVDSKCFAPDKNGSCKTLPLCPTGMKRRFTGFECCCVLRDSFKVIPAIVQNEKIKILIDTLDSIDNCFDKVENILQHRKKHSTSNESDKKVRIETLGRKVSDIMREGIYRLALLVDVEFETLLKMIFDEEKIHENDKILLVLKEADEIYDKGNEVLEKIAKIK